MNTEEDPENKRKHIVMLGAGFAGLEFCKAMKDVPVRVTLIDRQNYHLFQPLLYQVATAGLAAPEIARAVRAIFTEYPNVTTLMDEVTSVDLRSREVHCKEHTLTYDYLVIGLGVKTGYFGHDEWAKDAPGLKTLDDAMAIRRNVLLAFERAEMCEDPEEKRRLMNIVVVGGGPTGVEMAGSFAELSRRVLKKDFRRTDTAEAHIYLVEAAPRLLGMFDEKLSEYTRRHLEKMGVTVKLNSPVKRVEDDVVEFGDETVRAANVIWAAGIKAPELTSKLGVETDRAGRIKVNQDLSIPGHPEVFVAGDIAACIDAKGRNVPGLCPAAMQMGRHAAKVIANEVEREILLQPQPKEREAFSYFDKGSMATIGRSAAVASSMGLKFTGFIAWLMWLFVHLMFLVGFRNKLAVLLQWFYAYIHYQRGARIITGLEKIEKLPVKL